MAPHYIGTGRREVGREGERAREGGEVTYTHAHTQTHTHTHTCTYTLDVLTHSTVAPHCIGTGRREVGREGERRREVK